MIEENWFWWVTFNVFVLIMLTLDLGVFHRNEHEVKIREAMGWTIFWIALALVFNLGLFMGWIGTYEGSECRKAGLQFFTGYLIEKSLSMDNVFVFALIFGAFKIPAQYQHKILFWGIIGALIMRGMMIFAGVKLIAMFDEVMILFGGILLFSGFKLIFHKDDGLDIENNKILKLIRKALPVSQKLHGSRFFIRENGRRMATPLLVVLIFIEWTDLVFAVDSIPAIFAITRDPFIVYTSNVFAILGLRSLYFALAGILKLFHLLHYGLSVILIFVGVKMILIYFHYKIPTVFSLVFVVGVLATSIILSLKLKSIATGKEHHYPEDRQ
ncbi:TerC family protein [Kamptonema cortianum]|nr:TerC family protein [Kamptonema cortianum]MDL5046184.1 TerC family protein [Oscillatoria amoena NRMC-F 0135]